MFTIVDLAGSERLDRSKSTAIKLDEAKAINKSISALGNCINAIADKKHIPFRDSKLTRILTNCMSGNSKTTLIACISPSLIQYEETLLTLMFASRATSVSTLVKVNEEIMTQIKQKGIDYKMNNSLETKKEELEIQNMKLQDELNSLKKQTSYNDLKNKKRILANITSNKELCIQSTKNNNKEGVRRRLSSVIKRMTNVIRNLQNEIIKKVKIIKS